MKTNLSHILPVAEACSILGEDTVRRLVRSVLHFRQQQIYQQQQRRTSAAAGGAAAVSPPPLNQDEDLLVRALFYPTPSLRRKSSSSSAAAEKNPPPEGAPQSPEPVPSDISAAWLRLSRKSGPLAFDKTSFLQWAVPACTSPHSGHGGHLGLFDCLTHALHYASHNSNANSGTPPPLSSIAVSILLPDILIFFAICRGHFVSAKANNETNATSTTTTTTPMSILAFRIYDSYQKRGTVTRDTLHKFLSDIHGEESYRSRAVCKTLDAMFTIPHNDVVIAKDEEAAVKPVGGVVGRVVASLAANQFCNGISETMSSLSQDEREENDDNVVPQNSHILLDWIATLGNAMLPEHDIPQSTLAYLETISSSHRSTSRLCAKYGLAEGRLYEIKRRFHSMVESSHVLQIQTTTTSGEGGGSKLPMTEQDGAATASNSSSAAVVAAPPSSFGDFRPRHVITQDAFVKAVSTANDELGHGGYIPKELAQLTFEAGCPPINTDTGNPNSYWAMYDVLLFGCQAVRLDVQKSGGSKTNNKSNEASGGAVGVAEEQLMRLVFRAFSLLPREEDVAKGGDYETTQDDGRARRMLTRAQIGKMLLMLLQHASFRLEADSPMEDDDFLGKYANRDVSGERDSGVKEDSPKQKLEDTKVDVASASLLGILPSKLNRSSTNNDAFSDNGRKVALRLLIDFVLEEATSDIESKENDELPECLSFDMFCKWHYNNSSPTLPISQRRLGPYLLELRIVASVLFGIPPTRASLEKVLVEELQRRHKYRYPQTEVSRRGPRGTVWYVIDDIWFRGWCAFVERSSKSDSDVLDGRDDTAGSDAPRGLGTINNTGLLAENGSLALRPNIRWRQDYEIIAPLAWSALQAWYDGGPPIYRTVVPYVPVSGTASPHSRRDLRIRTEHEIELYPFFVTVFMCDAASRGESRPFQQGVPVSRVAPLRVLLVQLCKGLDVDPKFGRLWMMGNSPQEAMAGDVSNHARAASDWLLTLDENIVSQHDHRIGGNVGEHGRGHNMLLLLELKDEETGKWPRGVDGKTWTFRDNDRDGDLRNAAVTGDGIVGLYNMGNTCYLNSSIQCLSHTPVFRDYFTSKAYLNDINTTNPLGHQGRLAQVSAVLINSLWKRFNQTAMHHPKRMTAPGLYAPVNAPALTPKTFKESIGKFNDHFAGNEQHDAQELLAFLLGGLSEDLNRIVDKPYIEAPDSDGRPDSELADIWWSNHLKREMSIIVALFTGQYKSLLTCRSCGYESARFEPFSFLQLPLPEDDQISVSLILYARRGGTVTMKYSVRVRHDGRLLDVLVALAKVLHADAVVSGEDDSDYDDDQKTPLHTMRETKQIQSSANDNETAKSKEEDDEVNEKLEKMYRQIAQNLAVVDMREGFIFKIAPNSWSLPDLQNKDTGELPLLHVYELEPLPIVEKPSCEAEEVKAPESSSVDDGLPTTDDSVDKLSLEESDGESDEDEIDENAEGTAAQNGQKSKERKREEDAMNTEDVKYSFLAIAQRVTDVVSRDQLHPFSHRVFGTPLLLRVMDLEGYSGRDLYDLVARRIRNFVPKSALRFLVEDNESRAEEDEIEAEVTAAKQRGGTRQRRHQTMSDMEEVTSGPVPRYGFRLRITSRDGRRCALCPWFDCCVGCLVPDDDYPTIAMCGDSIVLDWHFAVDIATSGFGLRANQTDGTVSPSLRARTSSVTVKNHNSCGDGAKKNGYAGAITLEACLDAFAKEERIPEAYCSKCKDFRVQTKRMSLWRLPPVVIIQLKRFQFTQHMRRKLRDLVAFPVEGLDLSRIMASDTVTSDDGKDEEELPDIRSAKLVDEAENGDSNHTDEKTETTQADSSPPSSPSSNNDGRSVMLYDLYGVVHHQGALSGGHYVASLKSELDGQWRLFNDAQVYEIHSRDVVDSSAYILFYIRRDVNNSNLQDFWDTTAREGEGLTEEEVEKLMKGRADRCVIS